MSKLKVYAVGSHMLLRGDVKAQIIEVLRSIIVLSS